MKLELYAPRYMEILMREVQNKLVKDVVKSMGLKEINQPTSTIYYPNKVWDNIQVCYPDEYEEQTLNAVGVMNSTGNSTGNTITTNGAWPSTGFDVGPQITRTVTLRIYENYVEVLYDTNLIFDCRPFVLWTIEFANPLFDETLKKYIKKCFNYITLYNKFEDIINSLKNSASSYSNDIDGFRKFIKTVEKLKNEI